MVRLQNLLNLNLPYPLRWPGNLGKMSNYAVVCCQLYIDGKKIGPHNFLVQLRCEKSHKPLPGKEIEK